MNNLWARLKNRLRYLRSLLLQRPFTSALGFILIAWIGISHLVFVLEREAESGNIKSFLDGIWWGIITLLTVGYGDKYPVTDWGRVAAGVLAIAGVVSIAILTAKISSYFLEQALKERRGFVEEGQLKNHLIICGWKRDMNIFIEQVLKANPDVSSEKIVLVNNMPDSDIESLLLIPGMKKVKVIKGDFFVESVLKRARPQMAKKVLILADATPNAVGQIPTITEADARTIMTAMTLSNISKSTPVVAEILDAGMDEYLRLANVHEVVYSREYSRMLLSLSSCGVGLTNIFHDLLDPSSVYNLRTYEIPDILVEKTFADLQDYFKSRKNVCLVGVLENSGNTHVAKEMAIRKAQQTPNIAELVRNLQSVKHMRFNRPVFNPSSEYRIGEGAMAIVIEERIG